MKTRRISQEEYKRLNHNQRFTQMTSEIKKQAWGYIFAKHRRLHRVDLPHEYILSYAQYNYSVTDYCDIAANQRITEHEEAMVYFIKLLQPTPCGEGSGEEVIVAARKTGIEIGRWLLRSKFQRPIQAGGIEVLRVGVADDKYFPGKFLHVRCFIGTPQKGRRMVPYGTLPEISTTIMAGYGV